MRRGGRGRGGVGEGHFGVEDTFGGAEAVDAEHLVPAVWHLKGAAGVRLGEVEVRAALWCVPREFTRPGPDLHDGLFELGENTLFLKVTEGGCGGGVGRKSSIGGVCRQAGIDRGFFGDEVMGG